MGLNSYKEGTGLGDFFQGGHHFGDIYHVVKRPDCEYHIGLIANDIGILDIGNYKLRLRIILIENSRCLNQFSRIIDTDIPIVPAAQIFS